MLFDDVHQGLGAAYDPAKFYKDRRLYMTVGILLALWLVWVLGSTRLRVPATTQRDAARSRTGARCRRISGARTAHACSGAAPARKFLPPGQSSVRSSATPNRRGSCWSVIRASRQRTSHNSRTGTPSLRRAARAARATVQSHTPHRQADCMSSAIQNLESQLTRELGRVVVGAENSIRALIIALIARGHVLVQGVPGLGKTLLAKTLARVLGGEFKRMQGTPDLMPSDIIGVHVFDESKREFVFRPGPLFADVVLVDEINRTGPKTQSALLEAMEERQVERRTRGISAARGFPGARHAESARVRRHLSAARVAARPLHAAHRHRLPRARRRDARSSKRYGGAARGARPIPDAGRHRSRRCCSKRAQRRRARCTCPRR